MAAATLVPTEDQVFDALFGFIATVLGMPDTTDQIVKGFQNLVAGPLGSYVVVSPGIMQRQDFGRRRYDPDAGAVINGAHQTYSYQLDCYGPDGATWASLLHGAWGSMWGADNLRAGVLTPLYSDAPQQLNITNAEGQFEQRWMVRAFGQINQQIVLPQDFFSEARLDTMTVADQLP